MRAVLPAEAGGPAAPRIGDLPPPSPGPGEVLVAVAAAGLNHADLLQLRGDYPPPPGESSVPGLECAGTVVAAGRESSGSDAAPGGLFAPGARVMALVAGGAHAERAAIPVGQLMPLPASLSFVAGAAIPEAGLTAWTNLVVEGGLAAGESVLVTGATGGMGTMLVQLAKELGARVIAAGRNRERLERLRPLGADELVTLDGELPARVRALTAGRGVDLCVDLVGGAGIDGHLAALRNGGRLVLVGLLAGRRADVDLGVILSRRLRVVGSVLRARPRAEKAALVAAFSAFALSRFADGRLRPVLDRVLPLERAPEAYAALARGEVAGKIVLEM